METATQIPTAAGDADAASAPEPEGSSETQAPPDWRRWARHGLLFGVGGLVALTPWEAWSNGWLWHLCVVLAVGGPFAVLAVGERLNWQVLRRPWAIGLAVFVVCTLISAFTGRDVGQSVRFLRKEMMVFLAVFAGIALGATCVRDLRRLTVALAVSGLLACAMAIAAYHFYLHGADEVTRLQWVRDEVVDHDVPSDPHSLRAQFPLEHHTKLGFFAAIITLVVVHMGATARQRRWLWWVGVAAPLGALVLTMNRGGMAGLAVAAVVAALLANWRVSLGVLAGVIVAAVLLMPAHRREHYLSIFSPRTYTAEWSSMTYRFRGWQGTMRIIGDHPLLGVGYSWKNFEDVYPEYAVPEETQNKPHAHNNWLEIAAESGIPAAAGFALFQIGLLLSSLRAWWRRRPPGLAMLIGLQVLVLTVGMISYFMRERIGVLIWAIFGISAAAVALAEAAESPVSEEAAP